VNKKMRALRGKGVFVAKRSKRSNGEDLGDKVERGGGG